MHKIQVHSESLVYKMCESIVNRATVGNSANFKRRYNELRYYVEMASPCTDLLKFCLLILQQRGDAIGRLLHYAAKNLLSSPCTSLNKHEQKDRTKTLAEFPDHVSIDYGES